jgi:hypothetical protein
MFVAIELWQLIREWMIEHDFEYKAIAFVDSYPIYEVNPPHFMGSTSYMLIKHDEVEITAFKMDISNYNGSMESITIKGPSKKLNAALPNFFAELDNYLRRVPPTPINCDPNAPKLTISDSYFDGTGKNHPMIELLSNINVMVTNNVFENLNGPFCTMPPPVDKNTSL